MIYRMVAAAAALILSGFSSCWSCKPETLPTFCGRCDYGETAPAPLESASVSAGGLVIAFEGGTGGEEFVRYGFKGRSFAPYVPSVPLEIGEWYSATWSGGNGWPNGLPDGAPGRGPKDQRHDCIRYATSLTRVKPTPAQCARTRADELAACEGVLKSGGIHRLEARTRCREEVCG